MFFQYFFTINEKQNSLLFIKGIVSSAIISKYVSLFFGIFDLK